MNVIPLSLLCLLAFFKSIRTNQQRHWRLPQRWYVRFISNSLSLPPLTGLAWQTKFIRCADLYRSLIYMEKIELHMLRVRCMRYWTMIACNVMVVLIYFLCMTSSRLQVLLMGEVQANAFWLILFENHCNSLYFMSKIVSQCGGVMVVHFNAFQHSFHIAVTFQSHPMYLRFAMHTASGDRACSLSCLGQRFPILHPQLENQLKWACRSAENWRHC